MQHTWRVILFRTPKMLKNKKANPKQTPTFLSVACEFSCHVSLFVFCHQDRVPFVVPERVPWRMMYNTLNSKFTSEVQTSHNLDQYNQHFLAQKIFNRPDFADDFSNMSVSWAQFNKVQRSAGSPAKTHSGRHELKPHIAFKSCRRSFLVGRSPSGSGSRE